MHQYLLAPVTGRRSSELIPAYGYSSLEACLHSIPDGGSVMDVGAGMSTFGLVIARHRPDVSVVNFDYAYKTKELREELQDAAPNNLTYVPLDIVEGDVKEWRGSFDLGFSFWLLPHLSLEKDVSPAQNAAENMLTMMKSSGQLRVGPTRGFLKVFDCCVKVEMSKTDSAEERAIAAKNIVDQTRRNRMARCIYLVGNTLAAGYSGFPENEKDVGGITAH